MEQAGSVTGRCLCGAVRFRARAKPHQTTACHCSMCNRWSGGISLFVDADGAPEFEGTGNIAIYRSSEWGERGFCKTCGSSLFWRVVGKDVYTLSVGALDDTSEVKLTKEIFVEDQPQGYVFSGKIERLTGEQAMAAYIAKESTNKT